MNKKVYYIILTCIFGAFIFIWMIMNMTIPRMGVHLVRGETIQEIINETEGSIAENFFQKDKFVTLNGAIAKFAGQRYVNQVVMLENGHGSALMSDYSDEILENNAHKLKAFSDFCKENGATFTYAQAPYKNEPGNSQLPVGLEDYSNSISDRFGAFVRADGIDYIDLRIPLQEDPDGYYSNYYKTEHHWNCFGGFKGFVAIAEHMIEKYGDEIDPMVLDEENYTVDVYSKQHTGYYVSRVGRVMIPPEDFYLMYPLFETQQTCEIPHRDVIRTGSFHDTVIDPDTIADTSIHGMYGAYIGGDFPLVIHHSETAKTDKTILMFIDSFGPVPEAFLTTAYKNVIAVDLRWVALNGWEETAVDYFNLYQPDHVIVTFNPNQVIYEDSEQFRYGLKNEWNN